MAGSVSRQTRVSKISYILQLIFKQHGFYEKACRDSSCINQATYNVHVYVLSSLCAKTPTHTVSVLARFETLVNRYTRT